MFWIRRAAADVTGLVLPLGSARRRRYDIACVTLLIDLQQTSSFEPMSSPLLLLLWIVKRACYFPRHFQLKRGKSPHCRSRRYLTGCTGALHMRKATGYRLWSARGLEDVWSFIALLTPSTRSTLDVHKGLPFDCTISQEEVMIRLFI